MAPSDSGANFNSSTSTSAEIDPSPSTSALLPPLSTLTLSSPPHPSSHQRDRDASLSLDWPTCDSPTTTGPTGTACPNTLAITPSQGSHPPGPNCSLDVPPPIPRSRLTSRIRVLKGLLIGRGPYGGGGKDSAGEGSDGGTVLDGLDLKERLERVERELCSWVNASPSPFENGSGGGGANSSQTSPTAPTTRTSTEGEAGK